MFNLIVGAVNGSLPSERLLEGLPAHLEPVFRTNGVIIRQALTDLPTMWMPETDDSTSEQVAYVGNVSKIVPAGREVRFTLTPNAEIPPIPSGRIAAECDRLGISRWDLNRTRWTIKESDLFQSLLEIQALQIPRPTVFRLPSGPIDEGSIAVMMPLNPSFNAVWGAIQEVAATGNWRCERADDIWVHTAIIDDIASLIAKAKVVICDLTGRNSNVFYEAGVAHALGKEVVLITQSAQDVPFDLSHHRYIPYLNNGEGLRELSAKLSSRLNTLMMK